MSAPLLSRQESVAKVVTMLRGAIRPEVFWLQDGSFEARLTVDPDVAFAALQAEADRA